MLHGLILDQRQREREERQRERDRERGRERERERNKKSQHVPSRPAGWPVRFAEVSMNELAALPFLVLAAGSTCTDWTVTGQCRSVSFIHAFNT